MEFIGGIVVVGIFALIVLQLLGKKAKRPSQTDHEEPFDGGA